MIVPDFKNTYFEEVLEILRKKFKLGRVRLLLKEPRSVTEIYPNKSTKFDFNWANDGFI